MDSADHRRRRLVSIVQGVVTGLANRIVGVAVSLLSAPLTIGYLGPERYGVWALIGSLLAWVRLADLGIGNGLTNSLASAFGSEQRHLARIHVSSALLVLSAIALVLGLGMAAAWPWIDWTALFGLHTAAGQAEVGPALAASSIIFLLGFPMSIIGPSYMATQDGKISNYWQMGGNVLSLLALFAVTRTQGGMVWLVVAVSGTGLAVNLASGVWLFSRRQPAMSPRLRSARRDSARSLLRVGVQFFLIQILSLLVFETDNLVIAHYLGADHVPPYSLTYTLFAFTSIIQTILFRYVWVAYTEAIARRDIAWVKRTFLLNMAFSLASTALAIVPLIYIARPFLRLWAGQAAVPPFQLVLWMAGWSLINAFCSPIACLLAAASHMKAQVVYSAVSAAVNIALSIYLVQHWGVSGAIAATVLAYLVFICAPTAVDVTLLLRRLARAL